jgi:ATP-dependent DNA ligase
MVTLPLKIADRRAILADLVGNPRPTGRSSPATRTHRARLDAHTAPLVVGGFTCPRGSRRHLGALLVGAYEDGALAYWGKVGTGFNDATLRGLRALLEALESPTPHFADPPHGHGVRGVTWTRPAVVVLVAYRHGPPLRCASFRGLVVDDGQPANSECNAQPPTRPSIAEKTM